MSVHKKMKTFESVLIFRHFAFLILLPISIHLDPATVDPATVDFRYRRLNFLLLKKLATGDFFATVDFSKLKSSKIPIFSKNCKIG